MMYVPESHCNGFRIELTTFPVENILCILMGLMLTFAFLFRSVLGARGIGSIRIFIEYPFFQSRKSLFSTTFLSRTFAYCSVVNRKLFVH